MSFDRDSPKTTLKFSVGRNDKVSPGDFVGAIAGEANIPVEAIGHIRVLNYESFVDVNTDVADHVISIMRQAKIKGNKVRVELDTKFQGSDRGSDRGGRSSGREYGRDSGSDGKKKRRFTGRR